MNRFPRFSWFGFHLPLAASLLLILTMPFGQITSLGSDALQKELVTVAGKVLDIDGQPAAGATIEVANQFAKIQETTVADQDGAFSIQAAMPKGIFQQLKITAASGDGQHLWYHRPTQGLELADLQSMQIQLESTRSAQVRVQDPHGNAIPDAHVALQLSFPNTIHAITDPEGLATFLVPGSEEIGSVVAWKDHAGLDYQVYHLLRNQEHDQLSQKPEFPWESGEVLSLEGAAPLTVTFTDSDGKAIPEVDAYVWLLKKQQGDNELNLSYFTEHFTGKTNSSGRVSFNWFPQWQKEPTVIWPNAAGFVRSRIEYDPAVHNGSAAAQLERLIPVRGTVTFPDGQPAEGLNVVAAGAGYTFDRFRGSAKSDSSGRYEIMAAPNQIYMLTIMDEKWAAPAQSGFAVLPGKEVEEQDFVLRRASKVSGRVLDKETGQGVPEQYVFLTQHGIDLNSMGKEILPNPDNLRMWVCPMQQQVKASGKDGEFTFIVGEGDYNLFVRGFDAEKFTVGPEEEKQIDLKIEVQHKATFGGLVVDPLNQPVSAARLEGVPRNPHVDNEWTAVTNHEGRFQVERIAEEGFLHAVSADETLGAIAEIAKEDTEVSLQLAELGQASGRLMSEDGSQPAATVKLWYGVHIEDKESGLSTQRFGGQLRTDDDGMFTLLGLVPGREYTCTLADHPEGYVLTVATVTVEPGQRVELGQLNIPKTPEPYRPPTLEERIEAAFNVSGSPLKRFESGKKNIQSVNQNLLIVFADPTNPRVQTLMQIRFEDPDFRSLSDDFRFLAVPTDSQRLEAAQELATALDLPALSDSAELLLVVLNRDAEIVAKLDSKILCDGENFSKQRFLAELDRHRIHPLDGRQLLDEALAIAARENKRVLVQETATWCGPCHMLSRFLENNRQWEKDYVWVKMDHRWTDAQEIMQQLRDGADGGIPWFCILDADGNKLATSNLPDSGSNVGFPSSAEGSEHFANMLKGTCQRLSEEEVDELVAAILNR